MNDRLATVAHDQAQKSANAFWFWIVVTTLVGWNVGWWAVIPGACAVLTAIGSFRSTTRAVRLEEQRSAAAAHTNVLKDCDRVLEEYSRALEMYSGYELVDASRLPFSKDTIKAALKLAMRQAAGTQHFDSLKAALFSLAMFQHGVPSALEQMGLLGALDGKAEADVDSALSRADHVQKLSLQELNSLATEFA